MKKTLKWALWGLKLALVLAGATFMVLHWVDSTQWHKFWSYVVTLVLPFVPELFAALGIKISGGLHLAYLLFLIPSMAVGIDLDLYALWDGYDKVVHLASGVLATFVMLELLENCYVRELGRKQPDRRFMFLSLISFVALTAVGWECFEFFYDEIFGGTMQELIRPGVDDTMWDMTAALIGGLAASFAWLVWGGKKQQAKKA